MIRDRLRLLRLLPAAGGGTAAVLVLLQLLQALVPTAMAWAVGRLVTALTAGQPPLPPILLVVALLLAGQVGWLLLEPTNAYAARRVDGVIRTRVRAVAAALPGLDVLESPAFQDRAARAVDPGMGVARERSAGNAVTGQVTLIFRMVSALTAAALLATFSPLLAVALLTVSLAVRAVLRRQWMAIIDRLDADTAGQRYEFYVATQAVMGAAKDVRLFGLSDFFGGRFRAAAVRTYGPVWRSLLSVLRRQWWVGAVVTLCAAAALGFPAVAVLRGGLGPGDLIMVVLAGVGVLSISQMGLEAYDIEYGLRGLHAAGELAALSPPAARPAPAEPARHAPEVCFTDVVFTYPGGDRPVLAGLSLTLRPGQTVAIVGENGAGKTTLVKLLAGLYAPDSGTVTVDGSGPRVRRPPVTVLFQDFVRYPASVRDNVTAAVPPPHDDAAVRDALVRAGASGLPGDLDASLWNEGADGTDLSGGQWQRVALARALYAAGRGRRLLVLDEPTANLDVHAEAAFHEQVVAGVRDTTTVLISHRLATVRTADRIILLRDGRVAEDGTHDELLAYGGDYARFFTTQAAAFHGGAR
ncbi:ABC transporter ATP-binding protein [Actinoplanes sp. NPDC024001]|uniref:ABC transporter ATP-binding protein n=1 Tax=Actinoplanes sp. NPDC024001 TaxID=3154598 RepID=UPI0033D9A7B5